MPESTAATSPCSLLFPYRAGHQHRPRPPLGCVHVGWQLTAAQGCEVLSLYHARAPPTPSGRNLESAGEDPFLSGEYAVNFVQGFEHAKETPYPLQASACCKVRRTVTMRQWVGALSQAALRAS